MIRTTKLAKAAFVGIVIAAASGPSPALAGGKHAGDHGHHGTKAIGEPGKAAEVSRTVKVKMFDNYYEPETIKVSRGETVKFVIDNAGAFVHEFNIGTHKMHVAHQNEMMMMVEHGVLEPDKINLERMKMDTGGGQSMDHDDPNSVLLEPGKTAELIWKFSANDEIEIACNVPGHYDAGMVGHIHFKSGS